MVFGPPHVRCAPMEAIGGCGEANANLTGPCSRNHPRVRSARSLFYPPFEVFNTSQALMSLLYAAAPWNMCCVVMAPSNTHLDVSPANAVASANMCCGRAKHRWMAHSTEDVSTSTVLDLITK